MMAKIGGSWGTLHIFSNKSAEELVSVEVKVKTFQCDWVVSDAALVLAQNDISSDDAACRL